MLVESVYNRTSNMTEIDEISNRKIRNESSLARVPKQGVVALGNYKEIDSIDGCDVYIETKSRCPLLEHGADPYEMIFGERFVSCLRRFLDARTTSSSGWTDFRTGILREEIKS